MSRRPEDYLFHYILHPGEGDSGEAYSFDDLLRLYGIEAHAIRAIPFGLDALALRGMVHLYPEPREGYEKTRRTLEEGLLKGDLRKRLLRAGLIIHNPRLEEANDVRNEDDHGN